MYSRSQIDVLLASEWMMRFASRAPLAAHFRRHLVPFGLDLARFQPPDDINALRRRLGIPDAHVVIALRAFESPFKGLDHVRDALRLLSARRPICLLTTQSIGEFDEFLGKHHIIELGWIDDDDRMVEFYQAADFLVMPSLAEAFGMMAIEAMACGRPVICYSDTSLPEVTFAPDVGRAVSHGDVRELATAIDEWVDNVDEVRRRGERARDVACRHYGIDLHLDRLSAVYQAAIAGHARSPVT